MEDLEYWEDVVGESFCKHDLDYAPEKVKSVAEDIRVAHQCYGSAFYQPPAKEHPVYAELELLKKQLEEEKRKVTCQPCGGSGNTRSAVGTSHVAISTCTRCGGAGRHL